MLAVASGFQRVLPGNADLKPQSVCFGPAKHSGKACEGSARSGSVDTDSSAFLLDFAQGPGRLLGKLCATLAQTEKTNLKTWETGHP